MLLAIESGLKKRKGLTAIEVAFVVAIMVILSAMLIPRYLEYQEATRRAVAMDELKVLAEQCAIYAALSKNGKPPADLGALVTGLTAAQSSDGQVHGAFIVKKGYTSTASSFVDPWGTAYIYNSATRTISTNANGETTLSQVF